MTKMVFALQTVKPAPHTCRTCRYVQIGERVHCNHPVYPVKDRIIAFHEKYEYLHFHCDNWRDTK